ncbi:MAG: hypothetical protein GY795_34935, partial [Desulfobacterales bacterium]|nr:hypothetical protein [Desulfobacterales bacterium]
AEAEAKLEKERSEAEAKRQAIEKANQAKLKKEREERAKIEKELAEKKAEEDRILREEKIAKEKALQAGDTEKIQTLLSQFDLLRGGKLKSAKAQTAIKDAYTILSNVLKELNDNQSGGE